MAASKEDEFRALYYYEGLMNTRLGESIPRDTLIGAIQTIYNCWKLATSEQEKEKIDRAYLIWKEKCKAWEFRFRDKIPDFMLKRYEFSDKDNAILKAIESGWGIHSTNVGNDDPDPGDVNDFFMKPE
jgi:hypothetical protein